MDLRLMDAVPTEEERVAVDTLLGPAETGWEGGAWRDEDGRVAGESRVNVQPERVLAGDLVPLHCEPLQSGEVVYAGP